MTWNVMIVDDEAPARRNLVYSLAEYTGWRLVGNCRSAAEAREVLDAFDVDLIFLDIRMPHESGLAFAESLCDRPRRPLITFITAYDQHALAAFELYAIDYILKPFDDQRFARSLERAEQQLRMRGRGGSNEDMIRFLSEHRAVENGEAVPPLQYVVVRSMGYTERVHIDSVVWMASAGNYVELNTGKRRILHRTPMTQMEQRLPPGEFMRVHRTAIVRRSAVVRWSVEGDGQYAVELNTGDKVPVSERYIRDVRAEFAG